MERPDRDHSAVLHQPSWLRAENRIRHSHRRLLLIFPLMLALCACDPMTEGPVQGPSELFSLEIVDEVGPNAPWGKSVGDINGDGLPDIIVGGHRPRHLTIPERVLRKLGLLASPERKGELVWYENPHWTRHLVTDRLAIRTDIEVADIDGDGVNDLLVVADSGLYWLANGTWEAHRIGGEKFHDVEAADLDQDGQLEIVVRNQSLFGYENGDFVRIYHRSEPGKWTFEDYQAPHGEGLKLADLDGDGLEDIVVNGIWLRNPGAAPGGDTWQSFPYTRTDGDPDQIWRWQDVYIDTADFNGDGRTDIVLTPAEEAGNHYQIAWFENPGNAIAPWRKHLVDPNVESVHHFVGAGDIDLDGRVDIVTAEMNQGEGDNPVSVYLNTPAGWEQQILSYGGGHSLRLVDIDRDLDLDLVGTNWQIEGYQGNYPVMLWRNQSAQGNDWARHVIDEDRPGQATFILGADLDGDGLKDLVSGGYWYRNPGPLGGDWVRHRIGELATDAALLADFDGDGDTDILASGWRGYNEKPSLLEKIRNRLDADAVPFGNYGSRLVWAENDGTGNFTVRTNIQQANGDFLQGVAMTSGTDGSTRQILLSWHQEGVGLQGITLPARLREDVWPWSLVSEVSQAEALTVADLNRDGQDEVVLGTIVLESGEDRGWHPLVVDSGVQKPDRNRVADMDGDGRADIVVGFEAVSRDGELVWYRQPAMPDQGWQKHLIATVTGPMSLDLTDMDGDGDTDVVVGEHNLQHPEQARLIWFENLGSGTRWLGHLVHMGDEHHDGALALDLDNDGDQDLASIGWGHHRVQVYEQL